MRRAAAAAWLAVAALTAGCSDGGGDASNGDTTSPGSGDLVRLEAGDLASEQGDEDFCGVLAQMQELDPFGPDGAPTPQALRLAMAELVTVLVQLESSAPALVAPSAAALAEGIRTLDDDLRGVDYDLAAAASEGIVIDPAAYDSPVYETAGDNVSLYRSEVCDRTR